MDLSYLSGYIFGKFRKKDNDKFKTAQKDINFLYILRK